MSGRRLVIGFLVFVAVFVAALVYFQLFAYYSRERGAGQIEVAGRTLPVTGLDRIDATTSPLKLRACFRLDPAAVAGLPAAPEPTPLTPPPWFRCFDARRLSADLAAGTAQAHLAAADEPRGFDRIVAVYADGRGFMWRQLNDRFKD